MRNFVLYLTVHGIQTEVVMCNGQLTGGFMKYFVAVLLVLSFINSCNLFSPKIRSKTISAGNNVNIREQPNLQSKVLGQCNIGDEIDIYDIPENDYKSGDQKDYFRKVKCNKIVGWINCLYLAQNFTYNKNENYYAFSVILSNEGAYNPYLINVYTVSTKQIISKKELADGISFTANGKYAVVDFGSEVFHLNTILELPTMTIVKKLGVYSSASIIENKIIYNECFKIRKDEFEWKETIFENGKITLTGKTGTFNNN
jgi:hypothetical protein